MELKMKIALVGLAVAMSNHEAVERKEKELSRQNHIRRESMRGFEIKTHIPVKSHTCMYVKYL